VQEGTARMNEGLAALAPCALDAPVMDIVS
jgi:hypothetical protein